MTRAWQYIKVIWQYIKVIGVAVAICLLSAACSRAIVNGDGLAPALYQATEQVSRYDVSISFGKTDQGGMLVAKKYGNDIRIVCTSYFGMSLFDLSLSPDGYTLNNCIEPLRKEAIWKILSQDFRLLFMPVPSTKSTIDKAGNRILKSGKGLTRGKISYSPASQTAIVSHPWLRLKLVINPTTIQTQQ